MKLLDIPFNDTKPLIVRREFSVNGKFYEKGSIFDWKKRAIARRKVQQLYDIRKVIHEDSKTFPQKTTGVQKYVNALDVKHDMSKIDAVIFPSKQDDLDSVESMPELRKLADEAGAEYKVSKVQQREAIRIARGK